MSKIVDYDYTIKLLIIGDSGVGKTSIMTKFTDNIFTNDSTPTIGIDFKIRKLDIGGKTCKLQIVDTAGQERFRSITVSHYRNAMGVLLVFDLTRSDTFSNLEEWYTSIVKNTTRLPKIVLVGNKLDLQKVEVTDEQIDEFCKKYNTTYFKTSAKNDKELDRIFNSLSTQIIESMNIKMETRSDIVIEPIKKRRFNCAIL
jgi:small GTP-binding protein